MLVGDALAWCQKLNPNPWNQVLGLASYPLLMARLAPARRREMALTVVRAVLKGDTKVALELYHVQSCMVCFHVLGCTSRRWCQLRKECAGRCLVCKLQAVTS